MKLSGIADEAGASIDAQIRAHKELGWSYIDLRTVDGVQFTEVSDSIFESICEKVDQAGLKVACFASGIANWACKITDPFEQSVDTLKRTIPRMHKLNTRYIRVMSYPNDDLAEDAWGTEAVRRMQELGKIAEDAGIVLVVENCDGWASISADHYARFFERVNSPSVKAVYDTGNPSSHGQSNTWEWYEKAKPHIGFIHIKDHSTPTAEDQGEHTWLTEGNGFVKATLDDLKKEGYSGFVSIEPHLRKIIHEGKEIDQADLAYKTYVEYGNRLKALLASL